MRVSVKRASGKSDLTTPGGVVTSAKDFTVLRTFTGFSPISGLPDAEVIITGTNLTAATKVTFNKAETTTSVSKTATADQGQGAPQRDDGQDLADDEQQLQGQQQRQLHRAETAQADDQ